MKKDVMILQENGELRRIGFVEGNTFYSNRKKSKHFFRKADAWGLDYHTLINLPMTHGVANIVIRDTETGKKYKTTVENFTEKGFFLNYTDYNKQLFLKEDDWSVSA